MASTAPSIMLPRVTLNMVSTPNRVGLQERRALIVGQISPGTRAYGSIAFAANPLASATITLGGTAWTFVASGASGNQVNIAGSLSATLTAAATALNASVETNTAKCRYIATATGLIIIFKTAGTTGNAFTLAASLATPSGATLAGGAATTATGAAGLNADVGHTLSDIDVLCGSNSHAALVGRDYRAVNDRTNLDMILLSDNASGVCAYSTIAASGTATSAGVYIFSIAGQYDYSYVVQVNSGDTAATVITNLLAAVAADYRMPFISTSDQNGTAYFEACNSGTHANDWLLRVQGVVPGLTITLTGWANGATNPSLTTVFSPITNIRYTSVIWPAAYTITTASNYFLARKNVTNRVMDGRVFTYHNVALATAKTDAASANTSECVIFNNVPTSNSAYIGAHIPEPPDCITAQFVAARDLRFELNASITGVVSTTASADQFGGIQLASLPYFNTPLLYCGRPYPGSGYDQTSQLDAENHGVSIIGVNDAGTQVITGVVVTTNTTDAAGNPDTTWKFLEWIDTHSVCREYQVNNLRRQFEQSRMTLGDIIPNRDMVNPARMRGAVMGLVQDLQGFALVQDGQVARKFVQDNLQISFDMPNRTASIYEILPITGQLESIIGTVSITLGLQ